MNKNRVYMMTPRTFKRLTGMKINMRCGCQKHMLPDPTKVGEYEVYSPSGGTRWLIPCWRKSLG